jgi:hypothetical protein
MIGLDEEIRAQKGISTLGFCLRNFTKKEISRIEEENLSAFFSYLGDEG